MQCGCSVGQYLLGQVRVVDGSGDGDRADEGTEEESRLAIPGLAVGVVDEFSQHGEAFLHLTGVAGSGRTTSAGDIRGDAGHAAAGLGMIPMPRAEVTVDQLGVSPPPAELAGGDGPRAALAQGPLCSLGDELLSGVEVPVKTPVGQPGCCGSLKFPTLDH
jgi:hypothetical protein